MHPKLAEYRKSIRSNPDAFVQGIRSFCKTAQYKEEEKSLFDKILPWALAIGGGYLALKGGEYWGRHAHATNNQNGPVKGPIVGFLKALLPKGKKPKEPADPTVPWSIATGGGYY
jgi:hypothetical protein